MHLKAKIVSIIFLSLFASSLYSQNMELFKRLQAINTNKVVFYDIDGYKITSEVLKYNFSDVGLKKSYVSYAIKEKDIKVKLTGLKFKGYNITSSEKITVKLSQNNSYYFIKNKSKKITVIQFSSINKNDKIFEKKIVNLILKNSIPKTCFANLDIDSLNFVGRKLKLKDNCNWQTVNSVQCPFYGQISWSIHKDHQDATSAIEHQLEITKSKGLGEVVSEETIAVEFEGITTKAKRVIFEFKGAALVATSISGGKTLTIYYIAEKVRGNYVSCVLSHWNNDFINKSGLPTFLEQVLVLK